MRELRWICLRYLFARTHIHTYTVMCLFCFRKIAVKIATPSYELYEKLDLFFETEDFWSLLNVIKEIIDWKGWDCVSLVKDIPEYVLCHSEMAMGQRVMGQIGYQYSMGHMGQWVNGSCPTTMFVSE